MSATVANPHRHAIREAELDRVRALVGISGRVLELGSGEGWHARALAESGAFVVAFDLPTSRYRAAKVWPIMPFDGQRIPLATDSIDLVFTSHVLEHVEELPAWLDEIDRVLRSGGIAVHVVPSATWRALTIATKYALVIRRLALGRESLDWRAALVPTRHGVRGSAFGEIYSFNRRSWRRVLHRCGWSVVDAASLRVVYSGNHVLGDRLNMSQRRRLARVLGSSSYVLVTSKAPV